MRASHTSPPPSAISPVRGLWANPSPAWPKPGGKSSAICRQENFGREVIVKSWPRAVQTEPLRMAVFGLDQSMPDMRTYQSFGAIEAYNGSSSPSLSINIGEPSLGAGRTSRSEEARIHAELPQDHARVLLSIN